MMSSHPTHWRSQAFAVAVLALGGTLFFGSLHAVLIVPIWRRLLGGLPFALLAAGGLTWCHREFVARAIISARVVGGVLFGAGVWLALLPVTFVAAGLRVTGLRETLGGLEAAIEILVAATTGLLAGFALSRSRRVATACGVCLTTLVLAMAGPIAITVGHTQQQLLLGFLPIYVSAGAALSLLNRDQTQADPTQQ